MQAERVYKRLAGVKSWRFEQRSPGDPAAKGPCIWRREPSRSRRRWLWKYGICGIWVLAETLEQVVDSAVLPLYLGTSVTSDTGRRT